MPRVRAIKALTLNGAPFLKWVGGKRQLLPEILRRIPKQIRTYREPFVGGGAVFFALANERRFEDAVISDTNDELINAYRVVRDNLPMLIHWLKIHADLHSERHYYLTRDGNPYEPTERAARTIYLNRTCYNGLYRVNKEGRFNVPFGDYANPNICNEETLRAASDALQGVKIETCDFSGTIGYFTDMRAGDFAYLDPPFLPSSKTANFTAYQAGGFGVKETERLRDVLESDVWGSQFLLSSSDTAESRRIFQNFEIETVNARRNVNSDASKRGAVSELLIRHYRGNGTSLPRSELRNTSPAEAVDVQTALADGSAGSPI